MHKFTLFLLLACSLHSQDDARLISKVEPLNTIHRCVNGIICDFAFSPTDIGVLGTARAGFTDAPNLYSYIHNSSLIQFDPWRLMEQKAIGPKEHVEGWLSRVGELSHWGGIVGILANWFPQESQQLCSKICHDLFSYAATIITEARRDRDIAVDLISSVTGLTFPDLPTNENKPNEVK